MNLLGIFVWILVWGFGIPLFGVDSLFRMGDWFVLNGGKICIEKMLGFKGDAVRFFKPMFLFWPSLIQIE